MIIYNYSMINNEFISEEQALIDPLDEGNYLIPANSTTVKPLPLKDGFVSCYNKSLEIWEYVEDNRGKEVHHKETLQNLIYENIGPISNEYNMGKYEYIETDEEIYNKKLSSIEFAIKKTLDLKAREFGYDDINSIAKYIGYINKYQNECESLGLWCCDVWEFFYETYDIKNNIDYIFNNIDYIIETLPKYMEG